MAAATTGETDVEDYTEYSSKAEESFQQESSKMEQETPKDDFEDTELDSDVENMIDGEEDVDKLEEEMMSMPHLQEVLSELGTMKGERRVMVSQLTYPDIVSETFQNLINDDVCEEMKLHFVRSKNRSNDWSGILIMNFATTAAAEEGADMFRSMNSDLTIKTKADTFSAGQVMEQWARTEKESKHWTDRMLYIKNVSASVTKDQLEELFPSADDIVLRPNRSKVKKEDDTREAYAFYRTTDLAQAAACEYAEKVIELDGLQLRIFKYHVPAMRPLRGYLHLTERRVVLKYMDRLQAAVDAGRDDETFIVPEWCDKRLTTCKKLIEQDDKARSIAGLSAPSLAELREIPGVKVIRGTERRELLMRLGVIDRPRYSGGRASTGSANHAKNSSNSDRKRKVDGSNTNNKGSLLGAAPSLMTLNPVKPAIPSLLGAAPWMMRSGVGGSSSSSIGRAVSTSTPSYKLPTLSTTPFQTQTTSGYPGRTKMLRMDATGAYHENNAGSGTPVRSLLSNQGGNTAGRSANQRGRGGANKPVSLLSL